MEKPTCYFFTIDGFIRPVKREDAIGVLQMWLYGEPRFIIAEACSMSPAKVSAILRVYKEERLPEEWVKYAEEHRVGKSFASTPSRRRGGRP
jgi:hypothetical protein